MSTCYSVEKKKNVILLWVRTKYCIYSVTPATNKCFGTAGDHIAVFICIRALTSVCVCEARGYYNNMKFS